MRVDFPGVGRHLVVKLAAGERHASMLALSCSPPPRGWDKDKQWEKVVGRCVLLLCNVKTGGGAHSWHPWSSFIDASPPMGSKRNDVRASRSMTPWFDTGLRVDGTTVCFARLVRVPCEIGQTAGSTHRRLTLPRLACHQRKIIASGQEASPNPIL